MGPAWGDVAWWSCSCPQSARRLEASVWCGNREQGLDPHTVLVCCQLLHHDVLVMRVNQAGLPHTESLVHCREDIRFAWLKDKLSCGEWAEAVMYRCGGLCVDFISLSWYIWWYVEPDGRGVVLEQKWLFTGLEILMRIQMIRSEQAWLYTVLGPYMQSCDWCWFWWNVLHLI